MEVEYSGGGVLIFSYLILIHQLDDFGSLCDNFGSELIGCRFDGPPIACKRGLRGQLEPRQLERVSSLAAALIASQ